MNLSILTRLTKKRLIVLVVALIILIAGGYGYWQYQKGNKVLEADSTTQKEQLSLINKIGKLILLPQNETPQIATVSDKTKLPGEVFFANAENGDKVLIYNLAQQAIIYRPSINKIISVAPINAISNTTEQVEVSPSATASATPSVALPSPSPKSLVTPIPSPTPQP